MEALKTTGLFVFTAVCEILGCYLVYLWIRRGHGPWLLIPAIVSLLVFAWLLTLHPHATGRVYAAYGGVYIAVALLWLWLIDAVRPTTVDWVGASVCMLGMLIIMFGPRHA